MIKSGHLKFLRKINLHFVRVNKKLLLQNLSHYMHFGGDKSRKTYLLCGHQWASGQGLSNKIAVKVESVQRRVPGPNLFGQPTKPQNKWQIILR